MTLSDDETPSGWTGRLGPALSVREEQSNFRYSAATASDRSPIRPWPAAADRVVVEHSKAAVDRLAALIETAVRKSDDDAVTALDRTLQAAERLLSLASAEEDR